MWKVKRMNTALIVVQASGDRADGSATSLANRFGNMPLAAETIARLPATDELTTHDTGWLAAVLSTNIPAPGLTETLT